MNKPIPRDVMQAEDGTYIDEDDEGFMAMQLN